MSQKPELPTVGMRTDELRVLPGREEDDLVKNPFVSGEDDNGLIVEWYYEDCTVELRHDGVLYRVAEVREVGKV